MIVSVHNKLKGYDVGWIQVRARDRGIGEKTKGGRRSGLAD